MSNRKPDMYRLKLSGDVWAPQVQAFSGLRILLLNVAWRTQVHPAAAGLSMMHLPTP